MMNENGLSAGDILALTRNNDNADWMNNPFIYLVWLALLGGNGGGIFGNHGAMNAAAIQGSITRSDLFDGFNMQGVNEQLHNIQSGICEGFYTSNLNLTQSLNSIGNQLNDNRFAAQNCCCETNRNIDSVRSEAYRNTCDITTAIHSEGEATRALIQANTVQELRDRLEARDRDLMTANFKLTQGELGAQLISTLRPVPQPAYLTCSPYTSPIPSHFNYCYN